MHVRLIIKLIVNLGYYESLECKSSHGHGGGLKLNSEGLKCNCNNKLEH